ncbi:Putative nucleotide-diphospho-sugar transferase, glucose N-acetyltransferase 1 [Septoria linicola]|uniref:Nucleotide-diphospho-sugar transferase, glucose N-acetyltransferase 1 n=1 Tax=Septoria linicola TaxID=215465 RepID=A0A9Q9EN36_9PEZI|nr:Putative nucleotide-diphospho-sugar transferase, glucose N-acetyltransferase 1 [Septoria linicola]
MEDQITNRKQKRKSFLDRLQARQSRRVLWRTLLVITCILLALYTLQNYSREPVPIVTAVSQSATDTVDWSQYAYCQYVTNEAYLCNALMIFEALHRLGSKASRVMMYPEDYPVGGSSRAARLLSKARDEYGVVLQPIQLQVGSGEETWAASFTKLLAFNQTQYKRVLSLDSDATVLQSMDELFLLPSAPVAMPRAYWLEDENTFSSQVVLIEPSQLEMNRITEAFKHRNDSDFDMELLNNLYGKDCLVIPHRPYNLLTREFRQTGHKAYLGSADEKWDPDFHYNEAKYLHFSDWPLRKPWTSASPRQKEDLMPHCTELSDGSQDCQDRDKWFFVYDDFKKRMK